jgi:hypothetical protein
VNTWLRHERAHRFRFEAEPTTVQTVTLLRRFLWTAMVAGLLVVAGAGAVELVAWYFDH